MLIISIIFSFLLLNEINQLCRYIVRERIESLLIIIIIRIEKLTY